MLRSLTNWKSCSFLQEIDTHRIFAEPVDVSEVPDYLNHIKQPMDFRTMRQKLDSFEYVSIDKVCLELQNVVVNCNYSLCMYQCFAQNLLLFRVTDALN